MHRVPGGPWRVCRALCAAGTRRHGAASGTHAVGVVVHAVLRIGWSLCTCCAAMISEYISNEQAEGQSCHASSVAVLGDGRCLATWFSGTHEKNPDVVIKLAVRSEESGWGEPFTIAAVRNAEGDPVAHWNPVLFVHGGAVTLYFKIGKTIDIWRQYQMTAPESVEDFSDISAWSSPVEMVQGPEGEAGRGA
eukprot:COSAG02_NODE_1491_length_12358_cov_52.348014_17_plen_191_part_01